MTPESIVRASTAENLEAERVANYKLLSDVCPPDSFPQYVFIEKVDVEEMAEEVLKRAKMFDTTTTVMDKIHFGYSSMVTLRISQNTINNIHKQEQRDTRFTSLFPKCMDFVRRFASSRGELGQVTIMRLTPLGVVGPHFDHGSYYALRDRYHLVIDSEKSTMHASSGEQSIFGPGDVFWLNNQAVHSASNHGKRNRYHLVFDVLPTKNFKIRDEVNRYLLENNRRD